MKYICTMDLSKEEGDDDDDDDEEEEEDECTHLKTP